MLYQVLTLHNINWKRRASIVRRFFDIAKPLAVYDHFTNHAVQKIEILLRLLISRIILLALDGRINIFA